MIYFLDNLFRFKKDIKNVNCINVKKFKKPKRLFFVFRNDIINILILSSFFYVTQNKFDKYFF